VTGAGPLSDLQTRASDLLLLCVHDTWALIKGRGFGSGRNQRLRAMVTLAVTGSVFGWLLSGVVLAAVCGIGTPFAVRIMARLHASRRRRLIDATAWDLATCLANAIRSGQSVQRALILSAERIDGPLCSELRTLALDLQMGVALTPALTGLRVRADSDRVGMIVAAIELQRRAGGDLADLLQRFADSFRARREAEQTARSATSQARFTGWIVIALPIGVILLVELARPGFLMAALSAPVALLLLAAGGLMHLIGSVAILRVARVRS